MGQVYVVSFAGVAVTAQQDLLSLLPATQKPITVHAVYLSQSTEVGDAMEEGLVIELRRGNTTVGSGGSAQTPIALDPNMAASATGGRKNDTTPASSGTAALLHREAWNIRAPFVYMPAPEDRPKCKNAEYLCLGLLTTPADAITMSGEIVFEE